MPDLDEGINLRLKCFIIGYLNLIVGLVDIMLHFFVVAVISRGFECDADIRLTQSIYLPWMGPLLFFLNIGTHGFYPFPIVYPFFYNTQIEYMSFPVQPKCYPGMVHIYHVDILNFVINAIWVKAVLSYVRAVHRKDAASMKMFYGLSILKLVIHVMYFAYQPYTNYAIPVQVYWCLALADIAIAALFLHITNKYIIYLRNEKSEKIADQPPSYIECLINAPQNKIEEKNVDALKAVENTIDIPTNVTAEREYQRTIKLV